MPVDLTAAPAPRNSLTPDLAQWESQAREAYAPNTVRAWASDWAIFSKFCHLQGENSLPAAASVVREFVLAQSHRAKTPATIRRYLATISRAHRAAGFQSPTSEEPVRLAIKAMGRSRPTRQRQARGLVWLEIAQFLAIAPRHLRDRRDRLLTALAYDTLCRREEMAGLRIENLTLHPDGSGSVLIARSKTDASGAGALAYLSPLTVRLLTDWLGATGLESGPILRQVKGSTTRGAITGQTVASVFKKVGRWIGLPPEEWRSLSGHSTRVGATQDLLALNIDLASIMQSGRWKDTRMPMRYGEQVLTSRSGMARAAKVQRRL